MALRDRPHIIILDVEMPVVNGYEAIRLLRQHPETQDATIVLLTALFVWSDLFVMRSTAAPAKGSTAMTIDVIGHDWWWEARYLGGTPVVTANEIHIPTGTRIEVVGTTPENLDELVDALGAGQEWLSEVPGYRSHTVLRGLAARGLDGAFAVTYSQWDGKAAYDAFRALPDAERSAAAQKSQARLDSVATGRDWNSYRVVHTRSAGN